MPVPLIHMSKNIKVAKLVVGKLANSVCAEALCHVYDPTFRNHFLLNKSRDESG
jgi:hypothetical protein